MTTYDNCECDDCGLMTLCMVTHDNESFTAVCSDCSRLAEECIADFVDDEEDFDCDGDEPRFTDMDDGQPSEYDEWQDVYGGDDYMERDFDMGDY